MEIIDFRNLLIKNGSSKSPVSDEVYKSLSLVRESYWPEKYDPEFDYIATSDEYEDGYGDEYELEDDSEKWFLL